MTWKLLCVCVLVIGSFQIHYGGVQRQNYEKRVIVQILMDQTIYYSSDLHGTKEFSLYELCASQPLHHMR